MARRLAGSSFALRFARLIAACLFLVGGLAHATTPLPTFGSSPSGTTATTTPTYTWFPSSGATSYSLRVTDSANVVVFTADGLSAAAANCAGTCFYQPGLVLTPDASYAWSVSASNDAGTSAFSPAISFTVSLSPPEAPSLVAPTGMISTATPGFSWTASLHATSYNVTVTDSSNANVIVQAVSPSDAGCSTGTGTCSFTPSPGLPNGSYTWYLYAGNASGNTFGGSAPFTVSALPPAPVQLAPSGSVTSGTPQFQWQPSVGATSYTLLVQDASGTVINASVAPADAGCDAGGTCAFAPSTALANGTYSWWVRAWNSLGHSPWSAGLVVTVSVPQPPPIPAAPALLSPLGSSISVSATPTYMWSASPLAAFYELDVFDFLGNAVLVITLQPNQCSVGTCSYSPFGNYLPPGNYTWQVSAGNFFGRTTSGAASFSVVPFFVPFTPVMVYPSGTIGTSSPMFQWDPSGGAAYYRLLVLDGSSATVFDQTYSALPGCTSMTCVTCGSECFVTPPIHLPLGSYSWTVAAINNSGTATSTSTPFTVAALPATPTQIGPSGTVTTGTPQFSWLPTIDDCPVGVICTASYQVRVQNASGIVIDMTLPVSSSNCSTSCSFTPTTPLANDTYSWFVRAWNAAGHSTWSSGLVFVVNAPAGLVPPTPLSPTGTVTTATPIFTWATVAAATEYQVTVFDSSNNPAILISASCPSTQATCSGASAASLANGSYRWQVQAFNDVGAATSGRAAFTVNVTPAPPPPPVQIAPSGTVTTGTPDFWWNASDTATSYQWLVQNSSGVQVINTTLDASSLGCSGGGLCGHIPSAPLPNDTYSWWVRAWNALGHSPWSSGLVVVVNTTLAPTPPAAPVLDAPIGTIASASPTYTWEASDRASSYELQVLDGGAHVVIDLVKSAAQAGCGNGTGTCSLTPRNTLASATYNWTVTGINGAGAMPSFSRTFTVSLGGGVPAAPVQIAPNGTVTAATPTYSWSASSGATSYMLLVQNSSGTVINTTYLDTDVGCPGGTGTCSITPSTALTDGGVYSWWVRAVNASGHSTWSAGMAITVNVSGSGVPAPPMQIGPNGSVMTTTPTYQWRPSTGATSYRLLVQSSAGTIDTTYLPTDVGCSTGTTCSITPSTMLASHTTYSWWVRANNASGHSTWSSGMAITTP